ncbi:BrnT family toxin [Thioalkalivibrio sp. ALM2T]|uniref:BrnT family toxin n=1 Tax=Thioalkalivibrio sp. ALM2T TaxID=1158184 RepID=UPI0009DA2DCD|nr:BrnT family toxin [Thioalkalivibrio sp. ALM2T]
MNLSPFPRDWDEGNARKNVDKHGVRQSEAEQVFFNSPLLVLADEPHSRIEPRYHALGITHESRRLHITFTLREANTRIRVISARDMHRKERAIYEQEQEGS